MSLFQELKRRNVFRVGLAYAVGAWVLLQIIDFVLDAISAPNWIVQAALPWLEKSYAANELTLTWPDFFTSQRIFPAIRNGWSSGTNLTCAS